MGSLPVSQSGNHALLCATLVKLLKKTPIVHCGTGVGTWAVQLAKVHWRCHVVATAGPRNQEFLKSIGADETVDYSSQKFDELYKDAPFDCIFDLIGGARRLVLWERRSENAEASIKLCGCSTYQRGLMAASSVCGLKKCANTLHACGTGCLFAAGG